MSMVSSCLEVLEYVESAKNLARDFKLAVTKVSLIKQRLSDWGAAMSVEVPPEAQSGSHTIAFTYENECGVLIETTLQGIRGLLNTTSQMLGRHSFRCQRPGQSRWEMVYVGPRPLQSMSHIPACMSADVLAKVCFPSTSCIERCIAGVPIGFCGLVQQPIRQHRGLLRVCAPTPSAASRCFASENRLGPPGQEKVRQRHCSA